MNANEMKKMIDHMQYWVDDAICARNMGCDTSYQMQIYTALSSLAEDLTGLKVTCKYGKVYFKDTNEHKAPAELVGTVA